MHCETRNNRKFDLLLIEHPEKKEYTSIGAYIVNKKKTSMDLYR